MTTGVVQWTDIQTADADDAVGGDFQITNTFLGQIFDGVVDTTGDPNRSEFGALQDIVGPIHASGTVTALWAGPTAEIGNVQGLTIQIYLDGAAIDCLIPDASDGDMECTIVAEEVIGPVFINIALQDPDTGAMVDVQDESAAGTLWCSDVWPPGFVNDCRLQIAWSGTWNGQPISGVITSVTSESALDDGTSSITDSTVPTMTIDNFVLDDSLVAGMFILNEDGAVTGVIDEGDLTDFYAELDMTGEVKLVGILDDVTFTADVEIGTVTIPGVTFTFDSNVFTAVIADPQDLGQLTGTFSVIDLTAFIPGFGTLDADGTGYLD